MELNINISDPKEGKTYSLKLDEAKSRALRGKKIGDNIKGELIGFEGYEFEITGGSDHCGFPMRKDVDATGRKTVLLCGRTTGNKRVRKGMRIKRTVAGNTVYAKITQVNLKILKKGKTPLVKEGEGKEEIKDTETKEEPKTEEKETEKKPEEKKEEEVKDKEESKPEETKEENKNKKEK